jgi:hypothetical protein
MALTTLQAIRDKVRKITRTPDDYQMPDATLDEYIHTFILYDLPEQLRLFSLRTTLTFYTQPNVDTYETTTTVVTDPLYNFKNRYIAVHPPVFMAGIQAFYTQQRDVFYGYWPQTNTIADTLLRGNGGVGPFTGILTAHPAMQRSIIFTCINTLGASMVLIDNPINAQLGQLIVPNNSTISYGSINYVTGAFTVMFPNNTLAGATIYGECIAYQPGKPIAMLFYDEKFIIRPVPDKVYQIQIEADIRPTELLSANAIPYLEQWWQYIAYGAAKKLFDDRVDNESIQLIMPEYMNQENLCLRSTLTQQANERTVTIYTQGKNYGFGWFGAGGWPY